MTVEGSTAGNAPIIATAGSDTNINLAIMPKGTGNVGIGTTSPISTLQVSGKVTSSGLGIFGSGTTPPSYSRPQYVGDQGNEEQITIENDLPSATVGAGINY